MTDSVNKQALPSPVALRRSLFWRIHFWAALIASPFILVAALTGMLYALTPQIESHLYAGLDHVQHSGLRRSLDASVDAARAAAPSGWRLISVLPPVDESDTVKVNFVPPSTQGSEHEQHSGSMHSTAKPAASRPGFGLPAQTLVVYVDPYTTQVLGSLAHAERFGNWAKRLHSRMLQTDAWRWMIELAASSMLVMLVTGVYLWWASAKSAWLPSGRARGRVWWKEWHAFMGVAMFFMSVVVLGTGITWSKYAGAQIRAARDFVGQAGPKPPNSLKSISTNTGEALNWQDAWQKVRQVAPAVAVQLSAPEASDGVWSASSADPSQPLKRFDLRLDAYSGATLYYSAWEQQSLFGQVTGIGIPFHRGEFGWWNQLLLLMFGASVVFSLISGWLMFWKRRKAGSLGMPILLPGAWRSAPWSAWMIALIFMLTMPVLAIASLAIATLEIIGAWMRRNAPATII